MLDYFLEFKGEAKTINDAIVKCNFYLIAHNGSGLDSYFVLYDLPQWQTVVNLIKNGAGIVSLKVFNGYIHQKKFLNTFILDVEKFISTIR